jgi:hypothetical protein
VTPIELLPGTFCHRFILACLVFASAFVSAQNEAAPPVRGGLGAGVRDDFASRRSASPLLPITNSSAAEEGKGQHFAWKAALGESFEFLMAEHGYRLAHQRHTRNALSGPFVHDWFASVSNLHGWADGDSFHVNYIGHPMQGAITGFIQIQNDPQGRRQILSLSSSYWKSRSKALLWAAAYSLQFEIGPLSEASIGNVALERTSKSPHPQAYVDLVITPVVGTAWMIGEDALDRYVISRRIKGRVPRILARTLLNPCRSAANIIRAKVPWYRDKDETGNAK